MSGRRECAGTPAALELLRLVTALGEQMIRWLELCDTPEQREGFLADARQLFEEQMRCLAAAGAMLPSG